jgi:hypothetical protein
LTYITLLIALHCVVVSVCALFHCFRCSFGPCGTDVCTEQQAMESVAAMETNGMREAGYNYATLDDCFAMRRNNSTGELYPSPSLFPNGFANVVEKAHKAGFLFGVVRSTLAYRLA